MENQKNIISIQYDKVSQVGWGCKVLRTYCGWSNCPPKLFSARRRAFGAQRGNYKGHILPINCYLLRIPTTEGKKLFLWWEVLAAFQRGACQKVCDRDGQSQSQSYLHASEPWSCAGPEGMEGCKPIAFSAERIICCSLLLSLAVAAVYQVVMEEVMMDSMITV